MSLLSRSRALFVVIGALVVALALQAALVPVAGPARAESSATGSADDVSLDSDGDGVADRPDAMSAMSAARDLDERVEDLSQRSPSTQVFANPDGTRTTETFAGPVRAQDAASGRWEAIDTDLSKVGNVFVPGSAMGDMRFSAGGVGPLAEMTGADGQSVSWDWPTTLPAPTVDGPTLTYPDVIPDGDLVVEALPSGFSHSVVLSAPPTEPLELTLLIDTNDAKLTVGQDGSMEIVDPVAPDVQTGLPGATAADSAAVGGFEDPGSAPEPIVQAVQPLVSTRPSSSLS